MITNKSKRKIISKKEKLNRIAYEIAMGRVPKGWSKSEEFSGWYKGKDKVGDVAILEQIVDHTCAICRDGPDGDIRFLRIGCLYDLSEVSKKFRLDRESGLYILPFCKSCRGHFMFHILAPWLESKGHKDHPNYNGESIIQYV